MTGVLVDTSVWVDHFRHGNPALVRLLAQDAVLVHPLVLGEIACGTPNASKPLRIWEAASRTPSQHPGGAGIH